MVLARVAEYLFPSNSSTSSHILESNSSSSSSPVTQSRTHGQSSLGYGDTSFATTAEMDSSANEDTDDARYRYPHVVLAGGIGGLTGDMLMHSLDTVKTRQQGDPHRPPKYHSLGNTYYTIWRQEGIARGLYGGVTSAAVGSFAGTCIFFGTYEFTKRAMIDMGIAPSLAYLNAGFLADLAASPLYVPTEVLKTRLQLQGRYNNPYFKSGYNYRSTMHAARMIVNQEGFRALFYGYRATLYRDLPFSALQFAFYEKEREFAKWWVGSKDIGIALEILTGATAGGLAGTITCPLDVVKTRIQTQVHSTSSTPASFSSQVSRASSTSASSTISHHTSTAAPISSMAKRHISTSSPSTTFTKPGSVMLDTSSVMTGLGIIYRTEGLAGLFRGVAPRAVWTSVQSGTMLVLYQQLLRYFDENDIFVAKD